MPAAARSKKPTARPLDDSWMRVAEAATELGVSRFILMKYAMRGALSAEVHAGYTVISRESVERLKKDLAKAS